MRDLLAAVELTVGLRTDNDEVKATVPAALTLKLYSYGRPYIRPLRIQFARRGRGGLGDYIKQNFAHLARSRSYRVALLVLEGINLSALVERKNRWLSGHSSTPSLDRTSAPALIEGHAYRMAIRTQLIGWMLLQPRGKRGCEKHIVAVWVK